MNRHKEAKTSLANYLFSENGDDSRGLSAEHSIHDFKKATIKCKKATNNSILTSLMKINNGNPTIISRF